VVLNLHCRALGRAEPGTFVLIQKYPKNQVSREASLRSPTPQPVAQAFALQNGQNHGLQLFCPASHTHVQRFRKNVLCPFPSLKATIVPPVSPKAYLLTKNAFFNMSWVGTKYLLHPVWRPRILKRFFVIFQNNR
jgi:hypothetical protein